MSDGPATGIIPLAGWADRQLAAIAALAGTADLGALSGAGLLGERAALNGFVVPGTVSAGGGCRFHATSNGYVALNLARPEDRELLPALFGDAALDPTEDGGIDARMAAGDTGDIVARGRELGLAIAALDEQPASPALAIMMRGPAASDLPKRPLVIDLSALWAGPLAGNLLALAGCEVIKVESRNRPDAMRVGDPALFARLNGGKDSLALDLRDPAEREALTALLRCASIVIEAARPRALRQLGIDADALVRETPGLVWITITGHGAGQGTAVDAANWIGFGDDCGVAGGLSAALHEATGTIGFVGDAIADPLTGIAAAHATLEHHRHGGGVRLSVAMSGIAAEALADERSRDSVALDRSLSQWAGARGRPFPPAPDRSSCPVRPLGADNAVWLESWCAC